MYSFVKKILFAMPAERAHHFTTHTLKLLFKLPFFRLLFARAFTVRDKRLERKVFGLTFKNPVGLAAGFDKNAEFTDEFAAMGFGFIEIGTVTPRPQPGNPQPRLFRLTRDRALINRMGFNNKGAAEVGKNLENRPHSIIVGGNIGKNKDTPNESAEKDYLKCFDILYPYVDYFVVNVSSPNTPGLRALQDREPLERLLLSLQNANKKKPHPKPVLLKIAPDLTNSQLNDVIAIASAINLDGLIATNTTIERTGLSESGEKIGAIGAGGLSGAPVFKRSTEIIRYLRMHNSKIPIIAAGGIMSGEDALAKLDAGADLVQVYSGLVYRGPGLIKEINKAILSRLEEG